jgi:hypothetical protein
MIPTTTLLDYNLPSGRAMQHNATITITRENGLRLSVPVQIAVRGRAGGHTLAYAIAGLAALLGFVLLAGGT